jgi:hypothetical protein
MAEVTNAVAEHGWGIYASGYVRTPKQPDHWDYVFKVRHASREEFVAVLAQIPDLEILDVRVTD